MRWTLTKLGVPICVDKAVGLAVASKSESRTTFPVIRATCVRVRTGGLHEKVARGVGVCPIPASW